MMKKLMVLLAVTGSALVGANGGASAQSFYFGFGPGYGPSPYRYYEPAPRYYGGNPRYEAYGDDCYWVTRRFYNEYRGVWMTRRVRVCD